MTPKYQVITPPASEPVTVDEAKRHARVFVQDADEDVYIGGLITAARTLLEANVCRSFVTQTIQATFDGFPYRHDRHDDSILLLYPPLQSVTSITYVDETGATQTLDPSLYTVDAGTPGFVRLAHGQQHWPTSCGPVVVTFTAGYGDPADVPETAKLAIKALVALWYENRQPIVTGTIVAKLPFVVEALSSSLWWGQY